MPPIRIRFVDLIVCTALLVLLCPVILAAEKMLDDANARRKCASNLRQIGQALLLYGNENRGSYPRTPYQQDDPSPKPTWGTPYEGHADLGPSNAADPYAADSRFQPDANDVTAALYQLMRCEDIVSRVFVCPSTNQTAWDFGGTPNTPLSWSNWNGNKCLRDHLSYSINNPYLSKQAIAAGLKWSISLDANYALMADMNPGWDELTKLNINSPKAQVRRGNSPNHGGDGQNVLYGDGHVAFVATPFAGQDHDNIYTYGPSGDKHPDTGGDGIEGAVSGPTDSVLLPTSKAIGAGEGAR